MSLPPDHKMTQVTADDLKRLSVDTINTGAKTLCPLPKTQMEAIARALEEPMLVAWTAIQQDRVVASEGGMTKQVCIEDILRNEFHANRLTIVVRMYHVTKPQIVHTHVLYGSSDLSDVPSECVTRGEEPAPLPAGQPAGGPIASSMMAEMEKFANEVGIPEDVYVKLIDHRDGDSCVDLIILELDIRCNLKLQYVIGAKELLTGIQASNSRIMGVSAQYITPHNGPAKFRVMTNKLGSPVNMVFVCLTGTEKAIPSCQPMELVVEKQMGQSTLKLHVDCYVCEQAIEPLVEARGCKRTHSSTHRD
ncbi:hypothetical protein K439DRAFT_1616934 [Ramaria rubella]|nr:hypothetical protein K439DRAFT_1616934 [Ramaria rubella]